MKILVADIGGTNSRFGLFCIKERPELLMYTNISTNSHRSQSSLLAEMHQNLSDTGGLKYAVFGVAGPVIGERVYPPNIEFVLDKREMEEALSCPVLVTNDMLLHAFFCLRARDADLVKIKDGIRPEGTIGVLAPGTGFGLCCLVPTEWAPLGIPSEGGHMLFPFRPDEFRYPLFISQELGLEYTFDKIVSGPGLIYLHQFLFGERISPKDVGPRLKEEPLYRSWAARVWGRAARHVALSFLALGGIFLAGGLTLQNQELVGEEFIEEFLDSRAMRPVLERIPIWLVKEELATLWGGAYYFESLIQIKRPRR
jgi:glucokinase